jgi:hypothetical protein
MRNKIAIGICLVSTLVGLLCIWKGYVLSFALTMVSGAWLLAGTWLGNYFSLFTKSMHERYDYVRGGGLKGQPLATTMISGGIILGLVSTLCYFFVS